MRQAVLALATMAATACHHSRTADIFYAACDAAKTAGKPLVITREWVVGDGECKPDTFRLPGGMIRPKPGAVVVLSGRMLTEAEYIAAISRK